MIIRLMVRLIKKNIYKRVIFQNHKVITKAKIKLN